MQHPLGPRHARVMGNVPVSHQAENLRGSFLPEACRGDSCEENPGSLCRYPEPETEPAGPHLEQGPPWCDNTAADAPKAGSRS